MTINTILSDAIDKGFVNTVTQSVTLATDQILLFRFTFRKVGSSAFTSFTWNGLACTIFMDQDSLNVRSICGYIKASSAATANFVSSVSPTFTQVNLGIIVAESTTGAFLASPIKGSFASKLDTETTYYLPSVAATGLTSGDVAFSFLDWLGWDTDYGNVQSTTASPASPLTLLDSVQNSNNPNSPGRMYISSATGQTGSVSFTHTKTGAGEPMYNAAVVVLFESSFLIYTITDPLASGAAFSGTSTGFANGAATLSSNGLSVGVTIASGAFSGTWPIAVDAQPYPTLPKASQTITLTQGGNSATITSDLYPVAGHVVVNFVSPITDDDTYPPYYFEQDGFTAEGAQFVYLPYSDLTMAADGEMEVTGEGVVTGYLIPSTGTGAGNSYYYTFNVIDGGAVVSGGRGLTAASLTMTGLTMRGLTMSGL